MNAFVMSGESWLFAPLLETCEDTEPVTLIPEPTSPSGVLLSRRSSVTQGARKTPAQPSYVSSACWHFQQQEQAGMICRESGAIFACECVGERDCVIQRSIVSSCSQRHGDRLSAIINSPVSMTPQSSPVSPFRNTQNERFL